MTAPTKRFWLFASMAILIGACSKAPSDDSLKSDLALASQAQQVTPPVVSPLEQNNATNPYTTPVRRTQSASRAPVATVRRSNSAASSSAGQVVYQPAPQPTVKHTERDAAIGAASGAVIGAVSSRDKLKGGLIGAAVGGILGGVIGNNVDIKKPN
jgi:hypothetical protein